MVRTINRPHHPKLGSAPRRQDTIDVPEGEIQYMPRFISALEYKGLDQRARAYEYPYACSWNVLYVTTFVHLSLKQPIEPRSDISGEAIERRRAGRCTFDLSNASEGAWHDTVCKLEELGADDVNLGLQEGENDKKCTLIICKPLYRLHARQTRRVVPLIIQSNLNSMERQLRYVSLLVFHLFGSYESTPLSFRSLIRPDKRIARVS